MSPEIAPLVVFVPNGDAVEATRGPDPSSGLPQRLQHRPSPRSEIFLFWSLMFTSCHRSLARCILMQGLHPRLLDLARTADEHRENPWCSSSTGSLSLVVLFIMCPAPPAKGVHLDVLDRRVLAGTRRRKWNGVPVQRAKCRSVHQVEENRLALVSPL